MKRMHSFVLPAMVLFLSGMLLTSCGDIEHNLVLKNDGSGTLETSFDIGELMSMTQGFEGSGTEDVTISTDGATPDPVETEKKDPMEDLMKKVTDPTYNKDFDTTFSLLSIMPDSVKEKQTNLDMAKRVNIHMQSPALSSDLKLGIVMNFDHPAQLKDIVKYLESMETTPGLMESANPGGIQSENFLSFSVDMKNGLINVDSIDYSDIAVEMGMPLDSLSSPEDMGMVEMMIGSTKIRSIIHVPGDVKSCSNKDAILTKDDKVIVEYGFLDALKKGKVPGYTIHFTPKK